MAMSINNYKKGTTKDVAPFIGRHQPEEDSFFRAQDEHSTNIGFRPSLSMLQPIDRGQREDSNHAVLYAGTSDSPIARTKLTVKRSPSVDSGEDTFMPASWQSGHSTLRARRLNGNLDDKLADDESPILSDMMYFQA